MLQIRRKKNACNLPSEHKSGRWSIRFESQVPNLGCILSEQFLWKSSNRLFSIPWSDHNYWTHAQRYTASPCIRWHPHHFVPSLREITFHSLSSLISIRVGQETCSSHSTKHTAYLPIIRVLMMKKTNNLAVQYNTNGIFSWANQLALPS